MDLKDKKTQICSILYADIVNSSKIRPASLLVDLSDFLRNRIEKLISQYSLLYTNKTGDGFLALGATASQIAEASLSLLDAFKSRGWKAGGYNFDVQVRIGLDIGTVTLTEESGRIIDATGAMLNQAARIEPVTKENHVFCSSKFEHHLRSEGMPSGIHCVSVGEMPLAKKSGADHLYSLSRNNSPQEHSDDKFIPESENIPQIKRTITDMEKEAFKKMAFRIIKNLFQRKAGLLESMNPHVKCEVVDLDDSSFICRVFVEGQKKAACKIWKNKEGSIDRGLESGIMYRIGDDDVFNTGSMNECLTLQDDGFEIFFRPILGLRFMMNSSDRMSPDVAAEALWGDFVKMV